MMLDIRPVSILTRAILDTSPAWTITCNGFAATARPVAIRFESVETEYAAFRVVVIAGPHNEVRMPLEETTCYPCKPDAPFEPIPWPVMPGEVEIEEWRTLGPYEPELTAAGINRPAKWVLDTVFAEYRLDIRPGYHPSPRRFIDTDGSCVPVWVWEKN